MRQTLRVVCVLVLAVVSVHAQQANSSSASSIWAGNDHGGGGTGPIATTTSGTTVTWENSGEANQPFLWLYTPGASVAGSFVDPNAGTLDLDPVTMVFVADGGVFAPATGLLDSLMHLNFLGEASFLVPVCNTALEGGPTAHQVLFLAAASASGVLLSAATDLSGVCNRVVTISHGDDDAVAIDGILCAATDFYDQSYTQIFSNANGSITLGAGDTDFSQTQGEFDTGLPRISAFWTDLSPQFGSVSYTETSTGWTLDFSGVPEYATAGSSNTFSVGYNCTTGAILMNYPAAAQSATECLIGITPGGSLALNLPNLAQQPAPTFLATSASCGGAAFVPAGGGGLDSINFNYTNAGTPFDLAGCSIVFTPGTFGGVGGASANTYSVN